MNYEFSAGFVVYTRAENAIQYLLLHYASGHWDFPKGHIEKGETKEQAALRELQEETGLQKVIILNNFQHAIEYIFTNQKNQKLTHKTVYFFVAYSDKQQVTLSLEHRGYEWLDYKKALKKLTYHNAQSLLKKVHQRVLQENTVDI